MQLAIELDMQKLRAGDEDTLLLLAEYLTVYIQSILHESNPEEDTIDILQDVLVKIVRDYESLANLGTTEKVVNYCKIVARNSVVHHARRVRQEEQALDSYKEERKQLEYERTQTTNLDNETYIQLEQAVNKLPETQRLIIRHLQEGKNSREIAIELGLSLAQARIQKYRALQQLRKQLADVNIEENTP